MLSYTMDGLFRVMSKHRLSNLNSGKSCLLFPPENAMAAFDFAGKCGQYYNLLDSNRVANRVQTILHFNKPVGLAMNGQPAYVIICTYENTGHNQELV